jgi:hypothetical protein
MKMSRVLAIGAVVALVGSAWPVEAQRNNNNKPPQRSPQEQSDIESVVRLVDSSMQAEPLMAAGAAFGAKELSQGDVSIKWDSNHFVKGQDGSAYIPYTLAIDRASLPAKNVALYVRVIDEAQAEAFATSIAAAMAPPPPTDNKDKDKKAAPALPLRPTFSWDNVQFVDLPDDGKLGRAMQLKPGKYVAFFAVKERSAAPPKNQKNAPPAPVTKMGMLRRELVVPTYNAVDLGTSSVILAKSVEPMATTLSPQEQEANPYVFGPMKIVPQPEGKYAKTQELSVIFWIYGAREAATGKPDVTIDFNFHQRLTEGEKYFNRTAPQELNATSLPPEFSVAAGHQLPGSLVVPLASFPSGDYRLEIKVTDKPSGRTMTQSVNFTVLPS